MRSSRLYMGLAAGLAIASLSLAGGGQPLQGFTRGSHTTRRQTNPVQRAKLSDDPDVLDHNRKVEERKRAKKGRR